MLFSMDCPTVLLPSISFHNKLGLRLTKLSVKANICTASKSLVTGIYQLRMLRPDFAYKHSGQTLALGLDIIWARLFKASLA